MNFEVPFTKPVGIDRGFEKINVIWSIWLVALISILGSTMPVVATASLAAEIRFTFNYDVWIQTAVAYDGNLQSAFAYDSAAMLVETSEGNPTTGGRDLSGRFARFLAAEEAGPIWSVTKNLTAEENAAAHAAKHAGEFPELASEAEYTQAAQQFVKSPPGGALTKVRPNGDTLIYDPATNTFAVRKGVRDDY